jgi:hypothetical protein
LLLEKVTKFHKIFIKFCFQVEVKGAGGFDQVIRIIKNNIVWVAAGAVVLLASLIFCCCLAGEEQKEVKKD